MKLSTRTRYGIRAMLQLAQSRDSGPLQIRAIAENEQISVKYLEQLMAKLKSAGFVSSVRGAKGGYLLAKNAKEIKLSDVFSVLEGAVWPVECVDNKGYCDRWRDCVTRDVWAELQDVIENFLESITLQDMVERSEKQKAMENKNIMQAQQDKG